MALEINHSHFFQNKRERKCPLPKENLLLKSLVLKGPGLQGGSFPGAAVVKNLPEMRETRPALGRSPGEVNGYPLQYSCLENSMDRGAWWAIIHGIMSPAGLSD